MPVPLRKNNIRTGISISIEQRTKPVMGPGPVEVVAGFVGVSEPVLGEGDDEVMLGIVAKQMGILPRRRSPTSGG